MRPFDELCLAEPRLRKLEEIALGYAREFRDHVPRCRNWFWFGPALVSPDFYG
jgi:hypothetical protein